MFAFPRENGRAVLTRLSRCRVYVRSPLKVQSRGDPSTQPSLTHPPSPSSEIFNRGFICVVLIVFRLTRCGEIEIQPPRKLHLLSKPKTIWMLFTFGSFEIQISEANRMLHIFGHHARKTDKYYRWRILLLLIELFQLILISRQIMTNSIALRNQFS